MSFTVANKTEPVTPSSGLTAFYVDPTTKIMYTKDDTGAIKSQTGVPDAPSDGKTYARKNAAWDEITSTPENTTNKENTTVDTSTTKYPTVNLLRSHVLSQRKLLACGPTSEVTITDSGNGLVNVSSISANFCTLADFSGDIVNLTVPQLTGLQLVANQYTYVIANYNSGTPVYTTTTDNTIINHSTILNVVQIYWENLNALNELHTFKTGIYGLGLSNKTSHRLIHEKRFGYESGLALSEYGTRNIAISAGRVWYDSQEIATLAIASATAGHELHFYYHVDGVWNVSLVSQYNNTQYDNGTNLATATNNKYIVNWIYKSVNSFDRHSFLLLGNTEYTSIEAQSAKEPVKPNIISKQAILVGRIIVLKNASTATTINSAFDTTYNYSETVNHSDLANLDYASSGHTGFQASGTVYDAPLGTVSLPSYTFTGDQNTGVYSPTADEIAFSCGGVQQLKTNTTITTINNILTTTKSINRNVTTVTGNTTLDGTHDIVLCNLATALTITLPAASGLSGRTYVIKNINIGVVTIDGNASETIDGALTKDISIQYGSIVVTCNGTNWFII